MERGAWALSLAVLNTGVGAGVFDAPCHLEDTLFPFWGKPE